MEETTWNKLHLQSPENIHYYKSTLAGGEGICYVGNMPATIQDAQMVVVIVIKRTLLKCRKKNS